MFIVLPKDVKLTTFITITETIRHPNVGETGNKIQETNDGTSPEDSTFSRTIYDVTGIDCQTIGNSTFIESRDIFEINKTNLTDNPPSVSNITSIDDTGGITNATSGGGCGCGEEVHASIDDVLVKWLTIVSSFLTLAVAIVGVIASIQDRKDRKRCEAREKSLIEMTEMESGGTPDGETDDADDNATESIEAAADGSFDGNSTNSLSNPSNDIADCILEKPPNAISDGASDQAPSSATSEQDISSNSLIDTIDDSSCDTSSEVEYEDSLTRSLDNTSDTNSKGDRNSNSVDESAYSLPCDTSIEEEEHQEALDTSLDSSSIVTSIEVEGGDSDDIFEDLSTNKSTRRDIDLDFPEYPLQSSSGGRSTREYSGSEVPGNSMHESSDETPGDSLCEIQDEMSSDTSGDYAIGSESDSTVVRVCSSSIP